MTIEQALRIKPLFALSDAGLKNFLGKHLNQSELQSLGSNMDEAVKNFRTKSGNPKSKTPSPVVAKPVEKKKKSTGFYGEIVEV